MKTQGKSVYENSDKQEMSDNLYSLLLPVTEAHITQATAAKALGLKPSQTCPIAAAIRERVPSATEVAVSRLYAQFTVNDIAFTYDLPRDAQAFVEYFDEYEYVKPELFRLQLRRNIN